MKEENGLNKMNYECILCKKGFNCMKDYLRHESNDKHYRLKHKHTKKYFILKDYVKYVNGKSKIIMNGVIDKKRKEFLSKMIKNTTKNK